MSRPLLLFLATGLFFALACGAKEQAEEGLASAQKYAAEIEEGVEEIFREGSTEDIDLGAAAQNLQEAVKTLGAATRGADPVDFRELQKLLPKKLRGLERGEVTGEKTTLSGIGISQAEGIYTSDKGGRIAVKITDAGGMSGVLRAAAFAWEAVELDREWEDGFERTVTGEDGLRRYEKYDEGDRRGEINSFIVGRFAVGIEGRDVDFEALEKARSKTDFEALTALKDAGRKEPAPDE